MSDYPYFWCGVFGLKLTAVFNRLQSGLFDMTPEDEKAKALEALKNGDIILAPNHTYECGSSHSASCSCGAVEKTRPLIKAIYNALTPAPVAGDLGEADFDEPSKCEAVFMGINDMRLMVDPSVPEDMILFPDEATRKWFENRCDRMIDALKCIRKHIGKMQDNNPGYDFNADPLSTTLIEGWINTALDTEEFCPDWMCQAECPASEALKEHLQAATSQQGREFTLEEFVDLCMDTEEGQSSHDQYEAIAKSLAAKGIIRVKP